jgi:hypothetical protein
MKYLKVLLPLLIIGGGFAYYLYNKPHKNMEQASADLSIAADQLFKAFSEDEAAANTAYLNKVVQVSGKVRSSSLDENGNPSVVLESGDELSGVVCQMDELSKDQRKEFSAGEDVTFKCMCTGMLMDVVLVRCVEVK